MGGIWGRGGRFGSNLHLRRGRLGRSAQRASQVAPDFGKVLPKPYFRVVAVNLGRISICVEVGSDGFGIFWAVFWVVAVGLGLPSVYGAVGLDGL